MALGGGVLSSFHQRLSLVESMQREALKQDVRSERRDEEMIRRLDRMEQLLNGRRRP